MSYAPLAAIAVSAILVAVLCRTDPKRRRVTGSVEPRAGLGFRRVLALAACLPGLVFIVGGDAAAFLIWLGGCGVAGWLTALAYGGRATNRVANDSR